MNNSSKKTVVVGMSGGVDSSVAAFLLKEQGYEVKGIFMKNWSDTKDAKGDCAWRKDRDDALRVATQLGIPFETVDFEKEYKERVFEYMIREYQEARTPNPDVMCNKEIKFGVFFEYAKKLGADYVATGHYARCVSTATLKSSEDDNRADLNVGDFVLCKGKDPNKDQSYFLHQIDGKLLNNVLFPVGDYDKSEIRNIAEENNLITAGKKDSQGICFVGKVPMKDFLAQKINRHEGDIVNTEGKVLGKHEGVEFFTIGQRQGLGVGGGKPLYVVDRDLEKNILTVTDNKEDSRLYTEDVFCNSIHWISRKEPELPLTCTAKIRYRQEDQEMILNKTNDGKWHCKFLKPQWAVSSGQSVVIYKDDICLGGGIII